MSRSTTLNRRASPPRPTLMVGDLDACRAAFARLQATCATLLDSSADSSKWEDTVPRFRALRESLLSHQVSDSFAAAALEASSDACLRACNHSEFLKSVQHLVVTLYPALAQEEPEVVADMGRLSLREGNAIADSAPSTAAADETSSENGAPTSSPTSSAHAALTLSSPQAALARWPEFAGAFLLYFVCIPPTPQGMDIAAVLRSLPHSLQRCPEVAFALEVHLAVSGWDPVAFLRCHERATWLQRALLAPKLQQMRELAFMMLGSAYRSLSCAAAAKLLAMRGAGPEAAERKLAVLAQACAARGSGCAARALSGLQTSDQSAAKVLVFRA